MELILHWESREMREKVNNKIKNKMYRDFPGGTVVKNPPANAWVPSLVWEDPTCHGAAKPMRHKY